MFSKDRAGNPPTQNRILAALPAEEYARLAPYLVPVTLNLKQVVYKPLNEITQIYFPENCMISTVAMMSEGECVEVGVVGAEGLSGVSALLGVDSTPNESMAQIGGTALGLRTDAATQEFKRGGSFQSFVYRYVQANTVQISQSVVCNRLHMVVERLARWLLMTHDRAGSDSLEMTQEFLAMMLGVRRAGVTDAALSLQEYGLIKYKRGHITIVDRAELENASCECYQRVKTEYDRVLTYL